MKRLIASALLLLSLCCLMAQGQLDLRSRNIVRALANEPDSQLRYVSSVIKVADEAVLDSLHDMGVKIINRRDELLLAFIPIHAIDRIEGLSNVSSFSVGRQSLPLMDEARPMCGATDVMQGEGLPRCYDGTGIVVGFSDIGFDPNHLNFLDSGGKSRVKRVVNYVDSVGEIVDIESTDEISRWLTDRTEEYHATHVGGILAGSYRGNGYHGVATGAEIVATTSELYNGSILAGVENIVEYARNAGLPAVVNLSLGSYNGPHDGTDLFCQYLDRIGEEAIICISAGNEGTKQNSLSKTFAANDTNLNTFICNRSWDLIHIDGMSDFWSADSSAFSAKMCIYDCLEKKIVYHSPSVGGNTDVDELGIASAEVAEKEDISVEVFDSCFVGYMRLYAQLDSENNRYNMVFDYDVENFKFNQQWGRYCPGIMIEARAGMRIDGYADGSRSCFRAMGMANFVNGNSDRSISNMACGQNVIVVGSCNSRDKVPLMNGAEIDVTESVGTVSKFSGYGTLADGRSLPHVCAPGNMVISSISGAYIEQQNDDIRSKVVAVVDDGMRQHHWYALNGTSMSSPYAAGVYALWLQADPTLTVDEIREITIATADRSASDIADPRWGSGRLNALAGMKEVLSRTNIDAVDSVNDVIVTNDGGKQFIVQTLTYAVEQVTVYGVDGVAVLADKYDSDYVTVDMSAMPAGVYLMEIVSGGKRYIRRIMVR